MTNLTLEELARSVDDAWVDEEGCLYCPECASQKLCIAYGGVCDYECDACGKLLNDPGKLEARAARAAAEGE
jgi:hypothetical protein